MTPPPPTTSGAGATGGAAAPGVPGQANPGAGGTTGTGAGGASGTGTGGTKSSPGTSGNSSRGGSNTGASQRGNTSSGTSSSASGTRGTGSGQLPDTGVLQLTPAMLQQIIASAITATSSTHHKEPPVPKFWEAEPAAWFQVFRGHYQQRNLSQVALFNALLPLVPASAVALCRPFVGSTAADVFDQVERLLLQRFEMGPMERGKALSECTSLGDRTPEEMLQYMRSLQPGEPEGVLFRYLFVSSLPDGVREVVANIDSLDDIAKTAKNILQSNAAARISAVQSEVLDDSLATAEQVSALRRAPRPAQSPRRSLGSSGTTEGSDVVCKTHARYGRDAFKCDRPSTCHMRSMVRPRSGNGPAGRR